MPIRNNTRQSRKRSRPRARHVSQRRPRSARAQCGGGVLAFTGSILNDLVTIVVRALGAVSSAVENGVDTVGTAARTMGDDVLKLHTTQLFRGVAKSARQIGNGLGKVVTVIPVLGRPSAYVVESASEGVYHVVVAIGDTLGEAASRAGRVTQDTGNLVVFTLASAHVALDNIATRVKKKVRNITKDKDTGKKDKGAGRT